MLGPCGRARPRARRPDFDPRLRRPSQRAALHSGQRGRSGLAGPRARPRACVHLAPRGRQGDPGRSAERRDLPVRGLFVITRDDPLDDALASDAERLGWNVLRLGLLATDPGPDRGRFLEWLQGSPSEAAIAWTSRRAAQALVEIALPRS